MTMAAVPNQPGIRPKRVTPASAYSVGDLRATHPLYVEWWPEWAFLIAAYEGVKALVELGVVKQHERESNDAFIRRMSEAHGFNFSRTVVDLVNFYLFKRQAKRTLADAVNEDEAWIAFLDDCNHYGDAFNDFLADQARWAAVMGAVGFLIDKPMITAESRADERMLGIYPYLSAYHPPAILDWAFTRSRTGKMELTYLKLRDDAEDVPIYRVWTRDMWQVYSEPVNDDGRPLAGDEFAVLEAEGPNPLGEIPFVFMFNVRGRRRPIGVSDIGEVARIDLSIIRDLSQINEITGYCAFPMLLAPMEEIGKEAADDVGPSAVWEFDPDNPNSKPEWMIPAGGAAVAAIWDGIDRKAREIYRIANAGGLQAEGSPSVAKSGTALQAEFQQLNAKIAQKAINVENASNMILYFWLRWQGLDKYIPDCKIELPRDYDVHHLAQDLADALTAKTVVRSETFKREVEKSVARSVLPNAEDATMQTIDEEIENTTVRSLEDMPGGEELVEEEVPEPEDEEGEGNEFISPAETEE